VQEGASDTMRKPLGRCEFRKGTISEQDSKQAAPRVADESRVQRAIRRRCSCEATCDFFGFASFSCLPGTTARLHTRLMFSEQVLDHFQNPRNAGELENATASVEVSNPVCGDVLRVAARVEDGRIAQSRFLCRGCTTSIACASRMTELLNGKQISELQEITVEVLLVSFGELPQETIHGAHLAVDAARALHAKLTGRH
jgi:nitrogen fixation protein NifU and related proteins